LTQEGIPFLYHFTSVENLAGISNHQAIMSNEELEKAGQWPPPRPGGNDSSHWRDRRLGTWDKVHLFFTPHTPMAFRIKDQEHLCFFEVSSDVACLNGVWFTHANAASELARRGEGLEGISLVNFGYVKSPPIPWDRDWVHLSQAEVLVPGRLPLTYVNRIICVSQASKLEAARHWGQRTCPRIDVSLAPFASVPGGSYVGFSYVTNALIEAGGLQGQTLTVSKVANPTVTVVTSFEALAGDTCVVRADSANYLVQTTLPRAGSWQWKPNIDVSGLSSERHLVEILLGDIVWATLELVVTP
jgi:ssDNA thymidine ADP-ribosyltransferase, DarT